MLPTFTLLPNPTPGQLDHNFVHGKATPKDSNLSGYRESISSHIVKDYEGGHNSGFYLNISHSMRENMTPLNKWKMLPPFMRFKESANIKLYGSCSVTAREMGRYIIKMGENFDFGKERTALCVLESDNLKPIIAGNRRFLERMMREMLSHYKGTDFVVTDYLLSVD